MSVARSVFCDRLDAIRKAIVDFKIKDLPLLPANASHNSSARIIRNGLAVQCFNVFEDFVKARTREALYAISSSGVAFRHLPEDLQVASTVNAIKAVNFQLKLKDKSDRIPFAQLYSTRIASTNTTVIDLADISFFHASSNISKEGFREAISAFSVDKPWNQVSGLCSRVGISGLPAEGVFESFARRRHHAAHDAGASISDTDLEQSLQDATGFAVSFDILVSKATSRLTTLSAAPAISSKLISDHLSIPLRFIKATGTNFLEIRENAARGVKSGATSLSLVANASARSQRENGALLIYGSPGVLSTWIV